MANQVSRYQPIDSALTLRDAMDRLFEDSFIWPRAFRTMREYNGAGTLALDMYENQDEVVVNALVPGVRSEDLNIQVQDNRLIIDAKNLPQKVENVVWHLHELPYGEYHREVSLPTMVNADKIEATLNNGYLTLHLPKAEAVKPRKIQIKTAAK
ncbi:MAG: Hsp20/alpha crystallin family protein [Rudaea sp.]|jgi:HSP20 family protein